MQDAAPDSSADPRFSESGQDQHLVPMHQEGTVSIQIVRDWPDSLEHLRTVLGISDPARAELYRIMRRKVERR